MSMFETFGQLAGLADREANTFRKLDRLNKVLSHLEPNRVPISDRFRDGFTRRWREELGPPNDANPCHHDDLDFIVTAPNMAPWMRPFETLKETPHELVFKTVSGHTYAYIVKLVRGCGRHLLSPEVLSDQEATP